MATRIPTTVITGFLGAGKTTLIRHLLAHAGGRRIALIVNEFGDVGVDGGMIADCGDPACTPEELVELTNGCICCTVADDFIPTMEMLLSRDPAPDHIVIETSGLALPQPLVQAFNWPEVKGRATVDGVVAVVDARAVADGRFAADEQALSAQRVADPGLDHESPLEELFEDQLGCADLIVLSKTDLVCASELKTVRALVETGKRPAARIVSAVSGALPADLLIGMRIASEADIANRPAHHAHGEDGHEHDDFESFVLVLPPLGDGDAIRGRLAAAAETAGILRAKGFLAVDGKPMRLVLQGVGPRVETYYDRPWRPGETRAGRLVVIGMKGLDRRAVADTIGGELL